MKIKLTQKLPLDIKHGAVEGAVFEVTRYNMKKELYYFQGKTGDECGAYKIECEVIEGGEVGDYTEQYNSNDEEDSRWG